MKGMTEAQTNTWNTNVHLLTHGTPKQQAAAQKVINNMLDHLDSSVADKLRRTMTSFDKNMDQLEGFGKQVDDNMNAFFGVTDIDEEAEQYVAAVMQEQLNNLPEAPTGPIVIMRKTLEKMKPHVAGTSAEPVVLNMQKGATQALDLLDELTTDELIELLGRELPDEIQNVKSVSAQQKPEFQKYTQGLKSDIAQLEKDPSVNKPIYDILKLFSDFLSRLSQAFSALIQKQDVVKKPETPVMTKPRDSNIDSQRKLKTEITDLREGFIQRQEARQKTLDESPHHPSSRGLK